MTSFISETSLNTPIEEVYAFLEDSNNHEKLQPESIYNWTSTRDEASFTIKNMAKLNLMIKERKENEKIIFVSGNESPFEVSLNWFLSPNNNRTKVKLELNADLNMMMKMVASGPLQKVIDFQIKKLSELFS